VQNIGYFAYSRLLPFVRHLALRILTKKYRIIQQYTDWYQSSGEQEVSVCAHAHRLQSNWNYGHADFKQRISCNNGIRLQEFNTIVAFHSFWPLTLHREASTRTMNEGKNTTKAIQFAPFLSFQQTSGK
jgi:hypothetical protein